MLRKLSGLFVFLLALATAGATVSGAEDEYPVKPGNTGKVSCLNAPEVQYEIYLPSGYTPDGQPFPFLITFAPGGGGMISSFRPVAEKMQFIVVGSLQYKNGRDLNLINGSNYCVMQDVMARLNLDGTAIFSGGFSGGGWHSYEFSRNFCYLASGAIPGGGWLGGRVNHTSWNEYIPGLLVVRQTGASDKNAKVWLDSDAEHLRKFGVKINDITYEGGHSTPSAEVIGEGMKWLLDNRVKGKPDSQERAIQEYEKWSNELQTKSAGQVLSECFSVCQKEPRTWRAYMAHKVIYAILKESDTLKKKPPTRLGGGNPAAMFFGFIAQNAILSGDQQTAQSAVLCLSKLSGIDGKWYAVLLEAMCYGPDNRVTDPELAEDLCKLLLKTKSASEHQTYARIMLAEGYSLQGKWDAAKKELLKLKEPGADKDDKFKRAKDHIDNKKPNPLNE